MFTKINVALKDIWRLIDLMFSVCLHLCLCVHLHDMSFFIHHYRCWAEEQDSLSIQGSVVLWKETWFLLIIFLPLNKHTWPDESVSCLWLYGRHGWWYDRCLFTPQHPPGTLNTNTYITCWASYMPPHSNRQFMADKPTVVIRPSAQMAVFSLTNSL